MAEGKAAHSEKTQRIIFGQGKSKKTTAPGGTNLPHHPGDSPDRSTVPGYHTARVPPAKSLRRPLSQYGTAEEIMYTFRKYGDEITPKQFEQAPPSFQEMRKVDLQALPLVRPADSYAFDEAERRVIPIESGEEK